MSSKYQTEILKINAVLRNFHFSVILSKIARSKLTNAAVLSYILNKYVTYLFGSVFMGGMRDGRLLVKTVGASSPFLPDAMLGAMTPTLDSPVALALFNNIIIIENESVPKFVINNTINLFLKRQSAFCSFQTITVSECCLIKLLPYILFEKCIYFSTADGQPRQPALC